jgi:hypothetical protein
MFGILIMALVLLVVGAVMPAIANTKSTYGSELEQYINSRNPCDPADVERLTKEYDQKSQKNFL